MCRVIERSQEAQNIAQWRALNPALAGRMRRTSFEIDEYEVLPGIENLMQVAISMTVNPRRDDALLDHGPQVPQDVGLAFADGSHLGMQFGRQPGSLTL